MKEYTARLQHALQACKACLAEEKNRSKVLFLAGMVGLLLLAVSEWLPQPEAEPQTDAAVPTCETIDYAADLELRLQQFLSRVQGVGQAEVMVTLQSGQVTEYATDTRRTTAGDSEQQHVLLQNDAEALVETIFTPDVLGVAVVCTGGADPAVQSRVVQLVQALTDVSANHITVSPMTATN